MMKPWSEQYKPTTKEQIVTGNAYTQLEAVIKNKGVALLHGPTGTGKTCAVELIATLGNYELISMDSSDFRNSDGVTKKIGGSLEQQSLFMQEKIILIDELNGISGNEDRGGIQTLAKLLVKNKYPIILTAEDPFTTKLGPIKKKSLLIPFQPVPPEQIMQVLQPICEQENITYEEDDLKTIARRVGGDIRGAINDLQIHATTGTLVLSDTNEQHERGKEQNIIDALTLVLKSTSFETARHAFDNVKEDHKEILLWVDQNIPYEYRGEELLKAYDALSKADIFTRRIMRWQYWRYLVYVYQFLSTGVALAKNENKKGFVPYKRSSRPLRIWMKNQRNHRGKLICEKFALKTHTSKKHFFRDDIPFLQFMAKQNKLPDLGLDKDEEAWLMK